MFVISFYYCDICQLLAWPSTGCPDFATQAALTWSRSQVKAKSFNSCPNPPTIAAAAATIRDANSAQSSLELPESKVS